MSQSEASLDRRRLVRHALGDVERERDELREAAAAWLRFDNEVEPPRDDAPYTEHVAYETQKMEITERVAAAVEAARV